jgi:1,4-dihydroxy-2-naphthoate octaprenyltransferase
MGFAKAKVYHLALFVLAWLCFLGWMLSTPASPWRWLAAGFGVVHALHLVKVFKTTDPALLDPELKKIALSSFAMALIVFTTSG